MLPSSQSWTVWRANLISYWQHLPRQRRRRGRCVASWLSLELDLEWQMGMRMVMGLWRDQELKNPADSHCLHVAAFVAPVAPFCNLHNYRCLTLMQLRIRRMRRVQRFHRIQTMMEQRMTMWQWAKGGGGATFCCPVQLFITFNCCGQWGSNL